MEFLHIKMYLHTNEDIIGLISAIGVLMIVVVLMGTLERSVSSKNNQYHALPYHTMGISEEHDSEVTMTEVTESLLHSSKV